MKKRGFGFFIAVVVNILLGIGYVFLRSSFKVDASINYSYDFLKFFLIDFAFIVVQGILAAYYTKELSGRAIGIIVSIIVLGASGFILYSYEKIDPRITSLVVEYWNVFKIFMLILGINLFAIFNKKI